MATFQEGIAPRKRITTYGKAARRRILGSGFTSLSARPEAEVLLSSSPSVPLASSPEKLNTIRQISTSSTASSTSGLTKDVFDAPSSDDEAPHPIRKPATSNRPNTKKPKTAQPKKTAVLPVASTTRDVFDMPLSDEEVSNVTRRMKAPLIASSRKPKSIQQRSASKTPVSASVDVFDVPMSDNEAPLPAPKFGQKTRPVGPSINLLSKSKITARPAPTAFGETESRKKPRLSPVAKSVKRPAPVLPSKPSKTRGTSQPPQRSLPTSRLDAKLIKVVSRPKVLPPSQRSIPPKTPERVASAIQNEYGTPSPPLSDVDMMDVDAPAAKLSPKGMTLWKGLMESVGEADMKDIPKKSKLQATRVGRSSSEVRIFERTLSQPAGISKNSRSFAPAAPRRRLIDSLVEQAIIQEESEEDDSEEEEDSQSLTSEDSPNTDLFPARNGSVVPEPLPRPAVLPDSQSSQTIGPKITYSRQRSMLAEADLMTELALEMPSQPSQSSQGRRAPRGSIPKLQSLASFHEDAEDDNNASGVQSVHELRQAGVVNRFLDEVQDFLDRIGKPGTQLSMRRSGLLDLSSKIQDKNFARQFRANGAEHRLFVHLGQETDIVSGFIMVSLLVLVLVDNNMPHIVVHLRRQGITRLLIRLLECQSSIAAVSKERKTNMSKVAQSLLKEHHDKLLQMSIWEDLQPQTISPRMIALKCLELMVRQTREAGNSGDIFSKELTTNLFAILASSDEKCWNLPKEKEAIDFYLALSALESHSITARTVHDESIWISEYLPIVAETLEIALSQPLESFGVLQLLLLRLTLNVTNNNPAASDIFARESLMLPMGQVIVARFEQISRFLTEEDFSVAVDHLILVLGVMINFAEWSLPARECFNGLEGHASDPLDAMLKTFMDNQGRTSIAESLEESQKNVAFGYLSVLLGYLSLLPDISRRVRDRQPAKTLRPLLASIEEFIGHHKTVDNLAADEEGYNPQTVLTERLESLVNKLNPSRGSGI